MSWFGPDKRQNDQRSGQRTDVHRLGSERRENDRKQVQRRQYFRVVFPPAAEAPEITNLSAKVIDISVKAVKFMLPASEVNFTADSKIDMVLKFRDGQIINAVGTVLRQESDQLGKSVCVCIFDAEIPSAVINKEQSYLLKNFPDFCRKKFNF